MLDRENTIQILAARSKESRPPAWSLPSGGSKAANSRANPVGLIHELDLTNESRCGNSGCEEHSDDPTRKEGLECGEESEGVDRGKIHEARSGQDGAVDQRRLSRIEGRPERRGSNPKPADHALHRAASYGARQAARRVALRRRRWLQTPPPAKGAGDLTRPSHSSSRAFLIKRASSRKNFMRSIKERATSVCRRTYRCNSSGAMTGSLLGPS